MKKLIPLATIIISLAACSKPGEELPPPETTLPMTYINLKDTGIVFGRGAAFDLDGNGQKDVYFHTQLVGDPITRQDKRQWIAGTSFYTSLPVNESEEMPVLNYNDSIPVHDFRGYNWYNASSIILAEQRLPVNGTPFWEGLWKAASHRYIPIQLIKNSRLFNGWVEVSFSIVGEKLSVHRAAISTVPAVNIRAGR